MPKLTIDNKEIEFTTGQTILQVAKANGISIPHFCWHPALSVSGNCRVCLVEVEKMPKLVISCATLAADGMVVHTQSAKALNARKAVMEFILINHPLDCPICDEAGECKLQDYTYKHSIGESRFTEEKVKKSKRVPIGPHVMFDGDRCISCSRCIRFCDEIAKKPQLTFVKRGDRVTIETFPGQELDNPYSLNVTDICPVGALTNRSFRFKARVWDMSATKSICPGCSRGCNIDIWVRSNKILRLTPRTNLNVNQYWMCDNGRLNSFGHVNSDDRIKGAHIRKNGKLIQVGWDEAYALTVSELKNFNKDEIAFIFSTSSTLEDLYVSMKYAKSVLGVKHFGFRKPIVPNSGDDILITEDKSPNSAGAELILNSVAKTDNSFSTIIKLINEGKIKALYVVEEDIAAISEEANKALDKLEVLIVHSSNQNNTVEKANIVFPSSTFAEKNGTYVNSNGRVQRIKPAVTTAEMDRSLDNMELSRLDKFGTDFDRWGKVEKISARPTWKIFLGLANAVGNKMKYQMSEDIFIEMAKNLPQFAGLNYELIGEKGENIKK